MFTRPVNHPIARCYGDKDERFSWSMDPDNGFWLPIKARDGLGQHRGTDFSCPIGTDVHAMADGLIIRTRFENALDSTFGAGLYVLQIISAVGYDNWVLRYSHLREICVAPGDQVTSGQVIAKSGVSGDVYPYVDPYLHVDLMNLKRQWKAIPLG